MDNNYIIQLVAKLDGSKTPDDLKKIEQQLNAKGINLKTSLDTATSKQELQNLAKQLQSVLKANKMEIDTSKILSAFNQVSREAEKLTSKANKIQLQLDAGNYDRKLALLEASYRKLGLSSEEIKTKTQDVSTALDNLKKKNLDTLVQDEKAFSDALKKSQNEASILKTDLDKIYNPTKQSRLSNDILNWLSKNTAASKEAREQLQLYYSQLQNGRVSVANLEKIEQAWKKIDAEQRDLGKLGKNLKDQFSQAAESFTQWVSVSSVIMGVVYKTKEAVTELKEVDNILTEISKTSDMTSQELEKLGMSSYSSASKYGRTATDYLTGVQEMSRSGFYGDKGTAMAEQSLLAQSAGDMTSELANSYILATNAAFKYKGNAEKINEVLDGQNEINAMVSLYGNI